jgi:hypothetical protein
MAAAKDATKIERLRGLASTPEAQFDYALALVEKEANQDVLQAALDVLAQSSDRRARPALLDAYIVRSDGSRRDAGCYQRVAILRALRHVARRDDAGGLEQALLTYEFLPPGPVEVAAGLRSEALVTLNEVDESLAAYHAVRLLTDRHTSLMSGEPAATAARVLAAQGQDLPLYAYVVRQEQGVSEVLSECLRSLVALPASLLPAVVARYIATDDEIVLLGLFDLLFAHPHGATFHDNILEFMRATRLYGIYRYLATTIVVDRKEDLMAELRTALPAEPDRIKAEILQEALELR